MEQELKDFTEYLKNKNMKEKTIKAYVGRIKKLDLKSYNDLYNIDNIINLIKTKYNKESTQNSIINAILQFIYKIDDNDIINEYKKHSTIFSDKAGSIYLTQERINKTEFNDVIQLRNKYKITCLYDPTLENIILYTYLCIFTMIPVQRGEEYVNTIINSNITETDIKNGNINYNIINFITKKFYNHIGKTSGKYGIKIIDLSNELINELYFIRSCYLKLNNIFYISSNKLFPSIDTAEILYTKYIYKFNKKNNIFINNNALRASFVTDFDKNNSKQDSFNLAKQMGHSYAVQQIIYKQK